MTSTTFISTTGLHDERVVESNNVTPADDGKRDRDDVSEISSSSSRAIKFNMDSTGWLGVLGP